MEPSIDSDLLHRIAVPLSVDHASGERMQGVAYLVDRDRAVTADYLVEGDARGRLLTDGTWRDIHTEFVDTASGLTLMRFAPRSSATFRTVCRPPPNCPAALACGAQQIPISTPT